MKRHHTDRGTSTLRACGEAYAVYDILAFRVLGEQASWGERADFALQRLQAEQNARRRHEGPVTLDAIYAEADFSMYTARANTAIMQMELQIEAEMQEDLPNGLTLKQSAWTAYERLLAQMPDHQQLQHPALLASISRAVLLQYGKTPENLFAADVIAPVVVSVVYDLMARAHARGIRKLFFLARDAHLMYQIAQVFRPLFPEMELTYLYVSRTSLYLPSLTTVDAAGLNEIYTTMRYAGFSVGAFLQKYAPGLDLRKEFHSMEEVCADVATYTLLQQYHQQQQQFIEEYFQQMGLAQQEETVGVVDYNASGQTLVCINRLLRHMHCKPCVGFSHGISEARLNYPDLTSELVESIVHSERVHGLYIRISATTCLFEDYCLLTDHGRTTHYGRDAQGRAVPLLEQEPEELRRRNSRLFALHTQICCRWADYYMKTGAYTTSDYNITCTQWLLLKFTRNPRPEYLRCFVGMKGDIAGMEAQTIIKRLTPKEIFQVLTAKTIEHGSWGWLRGSVVATYGNFGRFVIWSLGKMKQIFHRVS
jgi:hypothetical protein